MRYEYELLSYISNIGINKVNHEIAVSIKRIISEFGEDTEIYLDYLKQNNVITIGEEIITIKCEKWAEIFLDKLKEVLGNNGLAIDCHFNQMECNVEFITNGSIKNFNLIFKQSDIEKYNYENNCIFMCMPNYYEQRLFWLDLLNDINVLLMFNAYISNEISNINKDKYRKIVEFDGISDSYISEIYMNSIKEYFKDYRKKSIIEFPYNYSYIIKKIMASEVESYYGVDFGDEILLVIKRNREITFLTIKDEDLVYSEKINQEINQLSDRILKKVSEYRKLAMFKENNTIDNTLKLISNLAIFFVPATIIINLLGIFNFNVESIKNYKIVLIVIMIILVFIQCGIIYLIYIPAIKLTKFKWKI